MVKEQYKEAITEVIEILKYTRKEEVDKISPSFMEYLQSNVSSTYTSNLDHTCTIDKMQLKKETRMILAIIYRKFWCNQENKQNFDRILNENERKHQEEIREKYNPDDIFKNKKMKDKEYTQNNNMQLMECKETIINKIMNKIKSIFIRNSNK